MGIQFTGLASGLDTQSIIAELMKVEQIKVDRVDKDKTKLEWKKEAWEELNTKLLDFYDKQIMTMNFQGTFLQNKVSNSNTDVADIQASVSSVRGTHTLEVTKLAKGSFLNSDTTVDKTATYVADGGDNKITLKVGDTSADIILEDGETYKDLVNKINDSGLEIKASYDEEFGRIFMSSTETGENTKISIEGVDDGAEKDYLGDLGFSFSTIVSGGSVDNINSITNVAVDTFNINGKDITLAVDDTAEELVKKINDVSTDTGVTAKIQDNQIVLSSSTGQNIQITAADSSDAYNFLTNVGLGGALNKDISSNTIEGSDGNDAEFTYNGTTLTSSNNDVKVNGINISLKSQTTSPITFSVSQDTDAIYEKVKEFVTTYNELIGEMHEKYSAPSIYGYNPLTDDEKAAMTEDEIKEYETKIKDSILRRDDKLQSITSSMRSILGSSVDGVGSLSDIGIYTGDWSERGKLHIYGDEDDPTFSPYTTNSAVSLKEMIEKDPEKVMNTINGLAKELRDDMQKKMALVKNTSSTRTFYSDKLMDKQLDDYEDRIDVLEDKMEDTEQRYYKKFTALEKLMQQLNNQSSWLTNQLAGLS